MVETIHFRMNFGELEVDIDLVKKGVTVKGETLAHVPSCGRHN